MNFPLNIPNPNNYSLLFQIDLQNSLRSDKQSKYVNGTGDVENIKDKDTSSEQHDLMNLQGQTQQRPYEETQGKV